MADMDIDVRPPSTEESWDWIYDTDEASTSDLPNSCYALLLEYLPERADFDLPSSHRRLH